MHPARLNKIDISKLNPQEQALFSKYGKLPTHKNVLMKMQKDRKYFDSGDYALSKAGKAPQSTVGTAIPNPENIPHASSPNGHTNGHPNISVSPTNSSNPLLKDNSGLASDENTTPPVDNQTQAAEVTSSTDATMADVSEPTIIEAATSSEAQIETAAPVASISVDAAAPTEASVLAEIVQSPE